MINSEPTPISFRSVSEQRAATALLLKEGQWNTDSQSFLTRETQLQEVSRHFMKQHQLLRVSPALLYTNEGKDLNAVYPQAPRELLKNYHVEASKLGQADPNPNHIKDIAEVLARRKNEGDHHRGASTAKQQQQQRNSTTSSRRKNGHDDDDDDDDDGDNEGGQKHQGDENELDKTVNDEDDNNEDDEDDDDFSSSTPFGASAQDARSQLENEFLKIAGSFDSRGESGVASHILSPSKYSRPSPFLSGSHAKRPAKDRGFVGSGRASEVLTGRGGDGAMNNNNNGESEGNVFFMTDMSTVASSRAGNGDYDDEDDNNYGDDNDDEQVTGSQLALSQSKLNTSRSSARGTGRTNHTSGTIPKLPTISQQQGGGSSRAGGIIGGTPTPTKNKQDNKYGRNVSPIKARFLANATAFSNTINKTVQQSPSSTNPYESVMLNATPVSIARYKNQTTTTTPSSQTMMTPQKSPYQSRDKEPVYSSLLHELRCTRQEVEQDAKRSSTLQAIANLGGTPEFRRTVTRIFANPDEADRISEEEMRRRQKLYEKLSKQQQRMDQEAEAAIGSSTLNMTRFGNNNSNSNNNNTTTLSSTTGNVGQDAVAAFERDMANVASKLSMS